MAKFSFYPEFPLYLDPAKASQQSDILKKILKPNSDYLAEHFLWEH